MRTTHLPRLLHSRSQFGYTPRSYEALAHEPEAVSADEQRSLTRRAQSTERERAADRVRAACEQITQALNVLDGAHGVDSQVRAMRRQLAQLQRRARSVR